MIPTYTITAARVEDLARLSAIELAAARLLAGHAPESVLNETTSLDVLKRAQREGRLWVALADDVPVGFAHVEVIEPEAAHLEEIDVHPDHGRRGLGAKLIRQVCRLGGKQRIRRRHVNNVSRRAMELAILFAARIRASSPQSSCPHRSVRPSRTKRVAGSTRRGAWS